MVESRGHLNPGAPEVALSRFPAGLDALVRWVWVARWTVPHGRTVTQRVLQYPSFNLVTGPVGAYLYGPRTVVGTRELAGRSWVAGVLLRPAAAPVLTTTAPAALTGAEEPFPGAPVAELTAAVHGSEPDRAVAAVVRDWLGPYADRVTDAGLLVNRACALAEERTDLVRADQLADATGVAPRTLERLVRAHVGLTPLWLIDCRRLQSAATTLREDPGADLAALAADLGYADQAHFTRRYRAVVGETPGATRRAARAAG
ncbi:MULTISPECIES: helix-turn-helix domain-containing protein [unclassified Pseudonocardia]|uniref:AraC family transcriptional regulator n=1 Tax=unclassified Pseudonocardia TaxID=2619320 RepID=UPI0002DAC68D|nr:helix-turn-helix domain-containing protein [Pseudonocardia sp. Ae707_Ps1]OLM17136.1 Transcriptional regulator, AraC family [Pseudonocardia sp. Ae707_Ps1]